MTLSVLRSIAARAFVATYALVVDDLDNGAEAAGVGVVAVDDDHTADLNKAPGGTLDQCFTHFAGGLKKYASVGCS